MKMKLNSHNAAFSVLLVVFMLFVINACKRESFTIATTDDVNITGFLEKNPEKFSLFSEILDRSGTKGYLAAYGKYTMFTPDNNAVNAWLKNLNKTAVSQLTPEELKDVVRYHVLQDTVSTAKFTDGKLAQITLYGQYLLTGVTFKEGTSSYVINKEALITQSNVRVGNGIIHVLDHVLVPASKTLAVSIESNSRYSIFTQAMKETGFYDSLNYVRANIPDTTRRFQTVVLESDSALRAAGFADYASLKAKLSKTGNPKSHADSLWMYVAYHISPGASYTADIVSSPSLTTLVPGEIVTTKLSGTKILLNDDEFNGVIEPGVEVNRTISNVTASNGVLHESKSFYKIKPRVPTGVFFDLGDQPELKALAAWRVPGQSISLLQNGKLITSGIRLDQIRSNTIGPVYSTSTLPFDNTRAYANRDLMNFNMSTSNNARAVWIELRTPMLVKGKYRVWICYTYNVGNYLLQTAVDVGTSQEQVLPNLMDTGQQLTASGVADANGGLPSADGLMLTNGFKRYMGTTAETATDGVTKGVLPTNSSNGWKAMVGKLAGVVDIKTTDRHWVRLTCLRGNGNGVNLDMIHFIPVDDDQNYPRFHPTPGVIFKRP
ncbi:fasciclin domain-containing protein [Pedobacter rhizosphaerae]|uniref:Uncaracterized surface protein containing fasciclin (FAS1) repeats n=1 Tax=Pedobacter rhizosphaerae TaxID=390241 RepID=A0A1H9QKD1_9SPHI|nr:fasciclin domain-containing protein [Pedobacter rhizosphaerae]SER60655.1 Uncaracterized surface protein containing fasciclin (FAS1) repeats [Pedobacter rhizosphaerae]